MPATVEIYADLICPWCYIGLDRLNRLVAAGLPLNRPDLMPNTQAHEIGLLAEASGFGDAYHRAVFNACFVQALNIGDQEVLAELGEEAGLVRKEVLEVISSGRPCKTAASWW